MGILDKLLNKNHSNMELVKIYSPVEDKNIRENLNDSPIWKKAYHEEDLPKLKASHQVIFEYGIKFDGLKPVQVTGVKKIKN
jgi:hypothetical protein